MPQNQSSRDASSPKWSPMAGNWDHSPATHYRLSILHQQHLVMEPGADYKLQPGNDLGSARAKDKKEEFLSQILTRLNELFVTDGLTDKDLINYAHTIRYQVSENKIVMDQIQNNSPEQ